METTHRPIVVKESKTPITALCSVEKEIWCATEGIISIWDASKKLLKKEFNAHHSVINQLLKIHQKGEFFSSSTLTVWSSSADGTVKIWDTKEHNNYSLIKTVSSDSESASCLCLVAHKYVWCGFQSKILICDLSGNSICTISVTNCFNLRIITSEQHVWCSIDNDIWIFRSDTHKNSKPLRVLSEQANSIQCFLFLKNYIWVGDSQGDITIWSCETFEKVASVKSAHNGSIFSLITIKSERKDHEVWSSGQDCLLRIWDSENYICVNALTSPDDYIKAMVVHLESGYLWTGSTTLCVWDETKTTNSDRLLTYTNGDKYVGQIATESPTERNGKGELHCQSGEIYVGYWLKDKRHGYGICTYCNKDKYYGFWREDQRWGHGVYVFNDGTCYDGMWKAGKKKGLGNLFMPNGDYIEGEWYEDEIIKGKFVKGSLDIVPTCSQNLFGACIEKLSLKEQKFTIIPFYKWNFFLPLQKKNIERLLQSSFPNNAITIKDLTVLLNDSTHPLGQAISDFNYMFNASYHYSYGEVKTLLSNAIDDIHSFINILCFKKTFF